MTSSNLHSSMTSLFDNTRTHKISNSTSSDENLFLTYRQLGLQIPRQSVGRQVGTAYFKNYLAFWKIFIILVPTRNIRMRFVRSFDGQATSNHLEFIRWGHLLQIFCQEGQIGIDYIATSTQPLSKTEEQIFKVCRQPIVSRGKN